MSKFEKNLHKLTSKPKDFSFAELQRLLQGFGYEEQQGAGFRVVFVNDRLQHKIKLHKPHHSNILKRYQIDLVIGELKRKDLLWRMC